MVLYNCEPCNYDTNRLSNYNKHLETKKHKDTIIHLTVLHNGDNGAENQAQSSSLEADNTFNTCICEYCNGSFSKKWNLDRHYDRCKEKPRIEAELTKKKEIDGNMVFRLMINRRHTGINRQQSKATQLHSTNLGRCTSVVKVCQWI